MARDGRERIESAMIVLTLRPSAAGGGQGPRLEGGFGPEEAGVASGAERSFRCRSRRRARCRLEGSGPQAGEPASNTALRKHRTSCRRSRRLQGLVRQRPRRHPRRHRPTSPSTNAAGETMTTSRTRTLGSRTHLESLIPPRTFIPVRIGDDYPGPRDRGGELAKRPTSPTTTATGRDPKYRQH